MDIIPFRRNQTQPSDFLCSPLDSCKLSIIPGILEPNPFTIVGIRIETYRISCILCDTFLSKYIPGPSSPQFIHHTTDAADVLHGRIDLPTMETVTNALVLVDWTVSADSLADLRPEHRQCRYYNEPPARDSFYGMFTETLCYMDCRIQAALRLCECVPFFYSTLDGSGNGGGRTTATKRPYCTVRGLYCLSQHDWFHSNETLCPCAAACDKIVFLVGESSSYEV